MYTLFFECMSWPCDHLFVTVNLIVHSWLSTMQSCCCRLRVSLSAAHTSEEVDKLAIAILEVVSDLDLVLEADTICAKL